MKLLVDEMHAPGIADILVAESFDVVAVAAQPGLRGMSDENLLSHATMQERAIVTENVADYMPLASLSAAAGRAHAGLVLTNPKRFHRATLAYPGNLISALRDFLVDPPITDESWTWWL